MNTLREELVEIGAVPYVFPKNIDERLKMLYKIKQILIYEIPAVKDMKPCRNYMLWLEIIKNGKTFIISRDNLHIVVVRSSDFNGRPMTELEFGLWHEYGHLNREHPNDPLKNDKSADEFAIQQLTELYDADEAYRIYIDFILNNYSVNVKTGEHSQIVEPYLHRESDLNDYLNKLNNK